jgi:hypothetical protein
MKQIFIAFLVMAYCWASNDDYESQQIAHGRGPVMVAQK